MTRVGHVPEAEEPWAAFLRSSGQAAALATRIGATLKDVATERPGVDEDAPSDEDGET